MPTATWTTELTPGGGYRYNEVLLTYNASTFDAVSPVRYNTLGDVTSWTAEVGGATTAIDQDYTFQGGTAVTFQSGTDYNFNYTEYIAGDTTWSNEALPSTTTWTLESK